MDNLKFQVISPIDNNLYLERDFTSNKEIENVLQSSSEAFFSWKKTSLEQRKTICRKVVEYFMNNAAEIGKEITHQIGRPIQYAPFEITKGFKERADLLIEIAEDALQNITVKPIEGYNRFIKKEPLGSVFVLAPWNYPYLTSVNAIIPAILAGNSVILKTAQQTPLCSERYAAAFEYADAPAGLFQYLHISHKQVGQVIQDSRIQYVAFTGSVNGGLAIQNALGSRFISSGLELGGKDPAYVRADADLNNAIENLVDGTNFNSGQSCCGIERIYVDTTIYKDFVDGFTELTKKYVLGNPLEINTTLGPLVRPESVEFIKYQIDEAIGQGAQLHITPQDFPLDFGPSYLAPQILTNVNHQMRIMTDETFGPVVGIMPVANEFEAITLMNDSKYGLTASIWTSEIEAGIRIGDEIDTGTVFINRCDYLDPALAWTGTKNSGRGCTLSSLGFDQLTRPKSYHLKQF